MDQLSLPEALHSKRNRLFLRLRQSIAFRRSGYSEKPETDVAARLGVLEMEARYALRDLRTGLSDATYEKNLLTLWTLELLLGKEFPAPARVLEAGSQDFARLPALARFFRAPVTGIELDAYPILRGLHSRADKASYYVKLTQGRHIYRQGDFFRESERTPAVVAFYPFVSPNPALAWGLPAEFGSPRPWLESLSRVLEPGGWALLVHQGSWEEQDFDEARAAFPELVLERRMIAQCPFSPQPYPPHASLYRRAAL